MVRFAQYFDLTNLIVENKDSHVYIELFKKTLDTIKLVFYATSEDFDLLGDLIVPFQIEIFLQTYLMEFFFDGQPLLITSIKKGFTINPKDDLSECKSLNLF